MDSYNFQSLPEQSRMQSAYNMFEYDDVDDYYSHPAPVQHLVPLESHDYDE